MATASGTELLARAAAALQAADRTRSTIDRSGRAAYDLDRPGRTVDLCRAVIDEAAAPADLHASRHAATSERLWCSIWLPVGIRRAWESPVPSARGIRLVADTRGMNAADHLRR